MYLNNYFFPIVIGFISGGFKVGDKVTKEDGSQEDEDSDAEYDRQAIAEALSRKSKYGKKGGSYQVGGTHSDQSFGGWEKHTKGIGQKLLGQMGYKAGQGLGKTLQGITTPVEAYKRKGKAAVGAYGTERTERSLKDFPAKPDSEEDEKEQFEQKLRQWKKGDQGDKKKKQVKYIYKTADQLLAEGPTKKKGRGEQSHLSKVKVIDMTGKEKRVLSGYHAIANKHDIPDDDIIEPTKALGDTKAFDMPELLHNLDLLVDMSEQEILQNDRKLKYEQDLIVNLQHEKDKSDEVCIYEEHQLEQLKEVLKIVEECEERNKLNSDNPMGLKECGEVLGRLQKDYPNEYKLYDLWALSIALVFPLMKKEFENWQPINKPRHGIVTIKEWKVILDEPINRPYQGGEPHMESYERLIWEIWMPPFRKASTNWSVKQPDCLIEVIEAWHPLLPEWIVHNILEQIILPKLQDEVDNWNPLTDTVPIHAWLHPWLPLMKDRLEPLYSPIRHKLSVALNNWHPSDPSAKMILEPWHTVFREGHMTAFVLKNIYPKLAMCMQEFVINPHQQHLDAWTWVMAWSDIVPKTNMVTLLLKNFFPKWLQVLCTWLSSNPNFDEVTKWFSGWKSMFSEALISDHQIKEELNKALELMNRAATGTWQGGPRESMSFLSRGERQQEYRQQLAQEKREIPGARSAMSNVPASFKELLQARAEENNLVFVPIPNKTWEAKQVYSYGRSQIYIDRGVVFVFDNGQWIPISLNNLVEKSK